MSGLKLDVSFPACKNSGAGAICVKEVGTVGSVASCSSILRRSLFQAPIQAREKQVAPLDRDGELRQIQNMANRLLLFVVGPQKNLFDIVQVILLFCTCSKLHGALCAVLDGASATSISALYLMGCLQSKHTVHAPFVQNQPPEFRRQRRLTPPCVNSKG